MAANRARKLQTGEVIYVSELLPTISGPEDLKKLSEEQLGQLADEIRQFLVHSVSQTGGHLAANLGVVELTLALHSLFNSPEDQIVWDVGHQSYVHKILTGRKDQFATLRKYGGLSGFPKSAESPHDIMDTGHASTSISAAVGLAIARDRKGASNRIAAVIGDGALTGGVAFEALDHAGHSGLNLIVILNDNEMSIAPNVGAMAGYLSRMRANPTIYRIREGLSKAIRQIPLVGLKLAGLLSRMKASLKYFVVPGMLFEELGFTYFGPVDGHNIGAMRRTLMDALSRGGPVLIHVRTVKGKGYQPAEENPQKFHGTNPFDVATGQVYPENGPPSYTRIFGQTITELGAVDDRIVAITAAMPQGTGLDRFARRYPERFFDVGIAEQHALSLAAGMARGGLRPLVAIYSTFLQRAYDQIMMDICLQKLPVVLAIDRAGIVGEDGPTHHGIFDYSYLRHIPNLTIMAPKDENELRHMLYTAFRLDGPVALRYPRGHGLGVLLDRELRLLPSGKGELLRHGKDIAILAAGAMVAVALQAAERLQNAGISCAVINVRYVKPLDETLILEWAKRTGAVLTIEENVAAGGFGSAVLELLQARGLNIPTTVLGLPDRFIEHGSYDILTTKYGLSVEAIERAAEGLIGRKGRPEVVEVAGVSEVSGV